MLQHSLDRVFHALSDPTRRKMIERLAKKPESVWGYEKYRLTYCAGQAL